MNKTRKTRKTRITRITKKICIGIIAHVDAGKTTVTEQLLALSGVIPTAGRVDYGNAVTDALALERKRGISIKATPISFNYGDIKINLIDTPGHADFIAEVERSLCVLDGVVLIVSAREGVQPQTRLFIRVIRARKLPCLIFINKTDRTGSEVRRVCDALHKAFGQRTLPMQTLYGEGGRDIRCEARDVKALFTDYVEICFDLEEEANGSPNGHVSGVQNVVTDDRLNDELLRCYVNEQPVTATLLYQALTKRTQKGALIPIFMGSALYGIGIRQLADALITYLPVVDYVDAEQASSQVSSQVLSQVSSQVSSHVSLVDLPLSGVVFKVDARTADRKAYVRLYAGRLCLRDTVRCGVVPEKITRLQRLENGKAVQAEIVEAGDVCLLFVKHLHVGDAVGEHPEAARSVKLARPVLEARIAPVDLADQRRLYEVLSAMSDEDPLIALDSRDDGLHIHLFGEVQMEIIQSSLADDYGLAVRFSEPKPRYMETPAEAGEAVIPYQATQLAAGVGLRVEPLPRDTGLRYRSEVWLGSLEKSFQHAVEEAVFAACKKGPRGLPLTDAEIIFIYSDYDSVNSTPAAFRQLAPQVLSKALTLTGTRLLEPMMTFELVCPETAAGRALFDCRRMNAEIVGTAADHGLFTITGFVSFVACRGYPLVLASYTEGEGIFVTRLHGYRDVIGM